MYTDNNKFSSPTASSLRQANATANANANVKVDPNFGAWQKHTKGVGLKILQKYNFQIGQGLGKDGTGRAYPVEAKIPVAKKGGIGFGEKSKKDVVSDDEEIVELKEQLAYWKAGAHTTETTPLQQNQSMYTKTKQQQQQQQTTTKKNINKPTFNFGSGLGMFYNNLYIYIYM